MNQLSKCVHFLQRLIHIESLPGSEAEISKMVASEMRELGYDEVSIDEAGNAIGVIKGSGQAPAVMFNTHLDHVDVGDHDRWPHPPFAAHTDSEHVWGRGAMDIKGPLAAQVYGIAALKESGAPPAGDVVVSAVVQEEVGGLGARHLATHLHVPYVVIGEASSNELRRGHRGRVEVTLHVRGRSVHASVPENGVNPLQVVARFLPKLETIEMRQDADLGRSSVAPTLIRTDQISANVIPSEVWLTCDWRSVAGESGEEIRERLQEMADRSLIEGASAEIVLQKFHRVSFTGLSMDIFADNPAFSLSPDHVAVKASERILGEAIGLNKPASIWKFATDGGHFAEAGMECIGFGPGDETLAHTINEKIRIEDLEVALRGNLALARGLGSAV